MVKNTDTRAVRCEHADSALRTWADKQHGRHRARGPCSEFTNGVKVWCKAVPLCVGAEAYFYRVGGPDAEIPDTPGDAQAHIGSFVLRGGAGTTEVSEADYWGYLTDCGLCTEVEVFWW